MKDTELQGFNSAQLMKSLMISAVVAVVLLVTVVWPAEYGKDPLGTGKLFGLTSMGELKVQLELEADADQLNDLIRQAQAAQFDQLAERLTTLEARVAELAVQESAAVNSEAPALAGETQDSIAEVKTQTMSVTLEPDQATEIKVEMLKGAKIDFSWTPVGGNLNFDTHGDPYDAERSFYHGYDKGLNSPGQTGELEAAFDGYHGWFWRNRSGSEVTVTLTVSGDYIAIKRVF